LTGGEHISRFWAEDIVSTGTIAKKKKRGAFPNKKKTEIKVVFKEGGKLNKNVEEKKIKKDKIKKKKKKEETYHTIKETYIHVGTEASESPDSGRRILLQVVCSHKKLVSYYSMPNRQAYIHVCKQRTSQNVV